MFWKAAVSIECDAGSFLVELSKTGDDYSWDPQWISTLRQRDQKKEEANLKVYLGFLVVMQNSSSSAFCFLDRWPQKAPKLILIH